MTEKIRIEDLTLGQIKELKKDISRQINNYLTDIVNYIDKDLDLGDIEIYVYTVYDEATCETCDGQKSLRFNTSIKFSRETDD